MLGWFDKRMHVGRLVITDETYQTQVILIFFIEENKWGVDEGSAGMSFSTEGWATRALDGWGDKLRQAWVADLD